MSKACKGRQALNTIAGLKAEADVSSTYGLFLAPSAREGHLPALSFFSSRLTTVKGRTTEQSGKIFLSTIQIFSFRLTLDKTNAGKNGRKSREN